MRLNKSGQYGMLLSLYLCRSGRTRLEDVAINLNLSQQLLEQIARKLRQGGVVKSTRGPGGGYELNSEATVLSVLNSVGVKPLLSEAESRALQMGPTEHRALVNFIGALSFNITDLLNTKISHVSEALVQQELAQLENISDNSTVN